MSTLPRRVPLTAAISPDHQKVFATLLKVNSECGLNAVLRVAGGWVRDTLLNVHSNDIDIAIETPATTSVQVSGRAFAEAISAFQASQEGGRARTVSTIRVNPELSKHIETATVCVHDIPVEFCALRTDDYCEDSRIPQVRAATALEDALRRDFTVNALFYNLHTGDVEDFTTGMDDLEARVLRCPLDPDQTFRDDPLRLLRGVRFVGQLGDLNFRLDRSIHACVDASLMQMLLQKVSRERVGIELTKMLTGARPEKCISVMHSMGVLQQVLLVEVHMEQLPGKKRVSAKIDRVVKLMDTAPAVAVEHLCQLNKVVVPLFSSTKAVEANEEERGLGFHFLADHKLVAAMFELVVPFFRGVTSRTELEERLYAVTINGLKMPLAIHNGVRRMLESYHALRDGGLTAEELAPVSGAMTSETKMKVFVALGPLNDKSAIPGAFKVVLLTYLLLECRADLLQQESPEPAAAFFAPLWSVVEVAPNLLTAYQMEPLLSGTDVRALPGVQSNQVGEILLEVRRSMVLDPTITRAALEEHVRSRYIAS